MNNEMLNSVPPFYLNDYIKLALQLRHCLAYVRDVLTPSERRKSYDEALHHIGAIMANSDACAAGYTKYIYFSDAQKHIHFERFKILFDELRILCCSIYLQHGIPKLVITNAHTQAPSTLSNDEIVAIKDVDIDQSCQYANSKATLH